MNILVKILIKIILWALISIGIIAAEMYGITQAGYIAMFAIWFITIVSIISVFLLDEESMAESGLKVRSHVAILVYWISLLLMITYGWFVTAAFSFIGWVLVYIKIKVAVEKRIKGV